VTVFCATSNPGKLREFQLAAMDSAGDFNVQPLARSVPPPEEHGATFEENAIEKARYYGQFANGYLFADDSGLEVDALGGAPGVHSARYAGPDATDAQNNALLLERLSGAANRRARFVCVIALVHDGQLVCTFRGSVEGRILEAPRGSGGFGYDPLFYHDSYKEGPGCTFAEAPIGHKMLVSHRGQALEAMFTFLRRTAASAGIRSSSSHPESSPTG
jgi:XTP/dITP diphosphohydrolase